MMRYIFFLLLCSLQLSAQTGRTLKIGTVYRTIDDSTGLKNVFEVWNDQCPPPANIYVHDTMWAIAGGYSPVRPAEPPVPYQIHDTVTNNIYVYIHDTIVVNPALPALTSIFTTQTLPTGLGNDGTGLELGVKFRSSVAGFIRAIRFYKVAGNSGTHTGELYTGAGARLGSAVFLNETTSGWQTAQFTTPIPIAANTTYVAAYLSPSGGYSNTGNIFAVSITNPPLTALADGTDGLNGVYKYTSVPAFPNLGYLKSNYWVDVIFSTK